MTSEASASGLLAQSAHRHPDRAALVDGDRRLTYAELDRLVDRLAGGLAARGVEAGDVVCLLAKNGVQLVGLYLAVNRIGAVAGMLNHRSSARELASLLDRMAPRLVAYQSALADKVSSRMGGRREETWIELGPTSAHRDSWGGLEASGADPAGVAVAGDAPAIMLPTSGTTGEPKIVTLSRRSEWLNTVMTLATIPTSATDRNLNLSPLFHAGPLECSFLPHLAAGALNVLASEFDPSRLAEVVAAEGITTLLLVPTHIQILRQQWADPSVEADRLRSLRDVVVTGARISQEALDWARSHLCDRVWNMYGLTEAGALIAVCRPEELDVTDEGPAVGRGIIGMDVRIARPAESPQDPPEFLPPGAVGELVCTGPKLMLGYLHDPAKTAERIVDGWLRTGDVGVAGPDGLARVFDRIDDLIISGGENVYPMEVEGALGALPGVSEVAVVGRPHDTWGEEVVAFVVPAGAGVSAEDLLGQAKELDIAPYKLPKRILLLDELPRTVSGKLIKRLLPD